MILSPHYLKRHKFAQKDMTQSSTFEMSTPSEIDESSQIKPNETPVYMTCLENDELTMVMISKEKYEQLKTLVQNVSTLTQQNANLEQNVSTLTQYNDYLEQRISTLIRENANLKRNVSILTSYNDSMMEGIGDFVEITVERMLRDSQPVMNRVAQRRSEVEHDDNREASNVWVEKAEQRLEASCIQDRTCLSSPQFVAESKLGTPWPPVEFFFLPGGRPCVINSLREIFQVDIGREMDACNISDIEGSRLDDGCWYLYSRKSSKTYFEFDWDTVAKVNSRKIREYANKYKIRELMARFSTEDGT
ncbi:hypothetical protein DICA1_A07558 [Diutina catenulata]